MLRPYVQSDLPEVLDAWYEASRIAHSFLSDEFFEAERIQIANDWMPIADVTVSEHEGRVIGFVAMVGDEVGGLFVHPDFQRRGIGRALLCSALESRPHLELDVFEANEIGRRFYRDFGFHQVDRHTSDATGYAELRLRFDDAMEAEPTSDLEAAVQPVALSLRPIGLRQSRFFPEEGESEDASDPAHGGLPRRFIPVVQHEV